MQWIKAQDRLPGSLIKLSLKIGGKPAWGYFIGSHTESQFHFESYFGFGALYKHQWEDIEWLDESKQPAPPSGQGEGMTDGEIEKEIIDFVDKTMDHMLLSPEQYVRERKRMLSQMQKVFKSLCKPESPLTPEPSFPSDDAIEKAFRSLQFDIPEEVSDFPLMSINDAITLCKWFMQSRTQSPGPSFSSMMWEKEAMEGRDFIKELQKCLGEFIKLMDEGGTGLGGLYFKAKSLLNPDKEKV